MNVANCVVKERLCQCTGKEGLLPSYRVMRMCQWMRCHFYDWYDYMGLYCDESY